jgi:hypothetical protein
MEESKEEKSIWDRDYNTLTLEEKSRIWSATIYQSMRDYMEQGSDQYD